MRDADEVWLVAGGEPGAMRFGQLVQRLRKDKQLSVGELASRADLSVGTIRAIEQGRRAPSEVTGVRLLRLLLPKSALSRAEDPSPGTSPMHLDYSFVDPQSGSRVALEFKARTAGDNRRWSTDRPRAGESKAEAFVRELLRDPERFSEWQQAFRRGVEPTLGALADFRSGAELPASDDSFGRIVRRLAAASPVRIERLETLLELWDRVDGAGADPFERDLSARVNSLIDGYVPLADGR